jgi:ABC-type protease/lipase transport system fused ATPase/permease subunit
LLKLHLFQVHMRDSQPLEVFPTPYAFNASFAPANATFDLPSSPPYDAMAWSLAAWFGALAACYLAVLVGRQLRRARALAYELARLELATLRPSGDSALPAPPNDYVAEPATYSEVV